MVIGATFMKRLMVFVLMTPLMLLPAFVVANAGEFTTFDPPPGSTSLIPTGINPAGAITGNYQDASFDLVHGFLRAPDGTFTTFDVPPGSTFLITTGINPAGAITGSFSDASGNHVFLRAPNGTFTTINIPGAISINPTAINPARAITGSYDDASFVTHGFLWIP
jgi:uncharacterized membrane protein